jgi:hypothetical protein
MESLERSMFGMALPNAVIFIRKNNKFCPQKYAVVCPQRALLVLPIQSVIAARCR